MIIKLLVMGSVLSAMSNSEQIKEKLQTEEDKERKVIKEYIDDLITIENE